MASVDREIAQAERLSHLHDGIASYFEIESQAQSGSYSDDDPSGRGIVTTKTYQAVPARVVWGGSTSRIIKPNGDGGYLFIYVTATLLDVPDIYYSLLERGRIIRVPQTSETGVVLLDCRIGDIQRSHESRTCTVIVTVDKPSQE